VKRAVLILAAVVAAQASTKITVAVIDPKTGHFLGDLKSEEFTVVDDKTPRRVESVELTRGPVDVMLLLDTSLVGGAVQPVAADLIKQLDAKDQMAVVGYHSSADLVQEFTASKDRLLRAISSVKFGNTPRLLDALWAAIDGGFESTTFRRVIVLVTSGLEGSSRMNEREVVKIARKNGVSIFPVYLSGMERSTFETLARQTGGVVFNLRDLKKNESQPGPVVFDALRQSYSVTISGNSTPGEKLKIEVRRPQKLFVSALPIE
jgi:VWFA-related protein